ncbi:hypothetical protein RDWZM_002911 [Blomia tropicalis]|uniref:DAGKc domain-containing protein n=1 Tax=Blomia tropicalis TaxID=40697 RepID=A0A9Q0RSK9_BLOTA|nr:hypothetical protein RDWZM_002911 [Blomia tropicalis]
MGRVIKIFKTLRNNWKKTVFFSALTAYGTYWGHGKYVEFNSMRAYCNEAMLYGQQKIAPLHPNRHVTVILNPVANKKNSKNDYEKYCAPLFHLSGLKVSVVVTEEEGQAKALMEIMDNTDCVIVAGGDGTVHETLTGLLRRPDCHLAVKRFPIGIVPVGKNNTIAYNLNRHVFTPGDTKVKILGESTMSVIRQLLNEVDVMKVEGDQGRPVYSLGALNVGQIRNTIGKLDEYWYLGQRMKPYLTFFFQSFRNLSNIWDDNENIEISYTKPCSGCSKCYQRFMDQPESLVDLNGQTNHNQTNRRWWHMFLPRNLPKQTKPDAKAIQLEQMKNTINEECDQWHTFSINSKNILIRNKIGTSQLEMITHPSDMKRSQFVKEGICKNKEFEGQEPPYQVVVAKDYQIKMPNIDDGEQLLLGEDQINHSESEVPVKEQTLTRRGRSIDENINGSFKLAEIESLPINPNGIKELDVDEITQEEKIEENVPEETTEELGHNKWLSIDNENYEYQSTLRITLLPQKVNIYHG